MSVVKIKQIIALALVFLISSKSCLAVFPPPTPSQETLDRLKKLGEENLQKYGDGGVQFINGEYVINTPIPLATLTPIQILTLAPISTKAVTPTPIAKTTIVKKIFSFNLASYIKNFYSFKR